MKNLCICWIIPDTGGLARLRTEARTELRGEALTGRTARWIDRALLEVTLDIAARAGRRAADPRACWIEAEGRPAVDPAVFWRRRVFDFLGRPAAVVGIAPAGLRP